MLLRLQNTFFEPQYSVTTSSESEVGIIIFVLQIKSVPFQYLAVYPEFPAFTSTNSESESVWTMDALFVPLANALDATPDQIKVIFLLHTWHRTDFKVFFEPQLMTCLLIAYPLGDLFIRIPSSKPALRHLFSIVLAIVFFFPVFQMYSAFFQFLASILVTYVVAEYHEGKSMPWVVFVCVAFHFSCWR